MKASVEARNSVCHTAIITANAFMHAGTTVDTFLRENLVRGCEKDVNKASLSDSLRVLRTASDPRQRSLR